MKTITLARLKEMQPCEEGLNWYRANFTKSGSYMVSTVVRKLMGENKFQWSNWFVVRCMTHIQKVRYAIFAAEQMIGIYEKENPNDDRPRKAIQAAKSYLKARGWKARAYAADAAFNASYAAFNTSYAAAYAAAHTAYAAAHAAYAADAAADTATYAAAYGAERKGLQAKIIKFGLKLI